MECHLHAVGHEVRGEKCALALKCHITHTLLVMMRCDESVAAIQYHSQTGGIMCDGIILLRIKCHSLAVS